VRRRREGHVTGTRRRGVTKNKERIVGESVSGEQVVGEGNEKEGREMRARL
jgi:hypothetical protein